MIKTSQQKEMSEYLVSRLEPNYENVKPKYRITAGNGLKANYLNLNNGEGILLLIDKQFPNDEFNGLFKAAREQFGKDSVAAVVYKDGKTFFRPAAPRHYFKMEKDLALKRYTDEDMKKMILFRPEEIFLNSMQNHTIQYYQPESERLGQGIVTYEFSNVRPDYSHIDPRARFKPIEKDYKRDHIWTEQQYFDRSLKLEHGLLVPL